MAHHLGVNAGQIEIGRQVFAAARDDHLGVAGFAQQGLHDRFHRQQLEIHRGIEFVEDHRFVEAAGNGRAGDFPGPLGFDVVDRLLLTAPDDRITAGAQVIHQVGIALAQRCNGTVLGVALAAFEPLQDQNAVALVLADAFADGLQRFAKGTGGFAFAFTGVDLDAFHAKLARSLVEMGAHFRLQVGQIDQRARSSTAGGNHLKARRFGRQGAHHVLFIEQPQVEQGVQFVEHHH